MARALPGCSSLITVADTAVKEGNSGTTTAQFKVTLSAAPATGQSVSVNVATGGGTATAGTDYAAAATTLTWVPGNALTKTVSVTVNGDTAVEPAETFLLTLSSPTGYTTISDAQGTATITNDD